MAAFLLGTLLSEWVADEADVWAALEQAAASGQVAWFARAVDTGDSEIAPVAALYLASWYQGQGDLERTRDAYQTGDRP